MNAAIVVPRSKRCLAAHAIGAVVLLVASLDAIAQTPHLPPITDAERAAALPDLAGHAAHDQAINSYVLFDQLEWQNADEGRALNWDATAWIGRDLDRLWLRTRGEHEGGRTANAEIEALWGHAFTRWWNLLAGVRQDPHPGPSQTWGAFGVQGIAPYKFDVEATVYLGESGQTAARFEAAYELLFTNRLILQPLVELNLHGKDDPRRSVGSGLSTSELGLRLRYELRREFAPYVGVTWNRKWGDTADFARMNGEDVDETRWVAGFRIWF
jgi:copper resistance protein B